MTIAIPEVQSRIRDEWRELVQRGSVDETVGEVLNLRESVGALDSPLLQAQLPGEMRVGYLPDRRLRVNLAFSVRFAMDEGRIVAEAPAFNEFGYGHDPSEALYDLQSAIAESFFELTPTRDHLGPEMFKLCDELSRHFVRS